MYHPLGFEPIRFNDAALPTGHHPVRWLSGRPGHPAGQVTLGWGLDAQTVIVVATCNVVRLLDKAARRQDCVFQALVGCQVGPVSLSTEQRRQAIERARAVADFEPITLTADDEVCTGAVSTVHGILVGHARVGTRVVTFAARGLGIERIRLRTLDSADGYTLDPTASQSPEDNEDQLPSFLRRR